MTVRFDSSAIVQGFLALLAGLLSAVQAWAFDPADRFDPYVLADIEVSAIAENAVTAKKMALDEAMEIAGRRLMRRLTANGTPPEPSAGEVETLLSSYENSREQVGTTGYSATYKIVFSPMLVRGFLAKRGLAVVDQPAPAILLIPVLVDDGVERWWDEAADFTAALSALDMEERLVPVRFPANSVEDQAARRDRLIDGDYLTLSAFRVRYRAHSAVIVRLDRVSGGEGMLVSLAGEDAAGPIDMSVEIAAGGMDAAATQIADILAERWKKIAMGAGTVGLTLGRSLPVRALLTHGSDEWDTLRRRLEASGAVNGLAVESMGGSDASIVIWFSGDLSDLPTRLAREGLDLFEAGGSWLLQTY